MSKFLINRTSGSLWSRLLMSRIKAKSPNPVWFATTAIRFETKPKNIDDEPIVYTKSKAFEYKASENFRVTDEETTYNPHTKLIINLSLLIFMAYFCIFREPNDVDNMLSRDLFELMPDLEIPMFEAELKRLEALGLDTTNTREKLQELKRLEETKK